MLLRITVSLLRAIGRIITYGPFLSCCIVIAQVGATMQEQGDDQLEPFQAQQGVRDLDLPCSTDTNEDKKQGGCL
jgi:hypothetical protein